MGNQYVKFWRWIYRYWYRWFFKYVLQLQWRSHAFGTTGSWDLVLVDYVFGLSSPFTINRRTASPANDWGVDVWGVFNTPNMIAYTTETNSIPLQMRCVIICRKYWFNWWVTFTPTLIMSIHGGTKNVGIGTLTPNASALLDLERLQRGLAIPTMTSTKHQAIASPKNH